MNLQTSTLKFDETGEPLHIQQAAQIRAFRAAWKEAGHTRTPLISVSRSIFALVDDRDRAYFGRGSQEEDKIGYLDENTRAIFGRSYAAEPDVLISSLGKTRRSPKPIRSCLRFGRRHQAVRILRQIPFIGPLRAAQLVAVMQTPHRFRSERQLWTYSGLAVETHDSSQYRYVDGQLQRSKKPQQVRGLNQNHNHAMKEIFKSAAESASRRAGPFQDFYEGLLAKGMKPELARVTLARKIAATTLTLWKKGDCFDPPQQVRDSGRGIFFPERHRRKGKEADRRRIFFS
jgi:hypothetical protein